MSGEALSASTLDWLSLEQQADEFEAGRRHVHLHYQVSSLVLNQVRHVAPRKGRFSHKHLE
jgi:hypothetical protein